MSSPVAEVGTGAPWLMCCSHSSSRARNRSPRSNRTASRKARRYSADTRAFALPTRWRAGRGLVVTRINGKVERMRLPLIATLALLLPPSLPAQTAYYRHAFFDNSLQRDYYFNSSAVATAPSTLEAQNMRLPVET